MPFSICVVDDQIPLGKGAFVDVGNRISTTTLQMLINEKETEWSEPVLKELVENLITDAKNWNVSAFMSPEILIKSMEEELYLPEFIIYDWDYGKTSEHSEELLKSILETSFSIVSVYTLSDKKDSVQTIIDTDLTLYKNRIILRIKSDPNSPSLLLEKIKEYDKTNFAFKFSKELRKLTHNTLESILIEFGKPDIDDITWLFGDEDESNNKKLNVKDLSEIIVEKLRNVLISNNFGSELTTVLSSYTPKSSSELVKKMWSYRLYYKPQDNIVRKGDIIKKAASDDETLYMIIASDCHLKKFWKKNFGYLIIIPVYKIQKNNKGLIDKLILNNPPSKLKLNKDVSSLTSLKKFDGPTIIPSIPVSAVAALDYILFPREIFSVQIPQPESVKETIRKVALSYEYISDYDGNNRVSMSEPFLTPLVEHILSNVSGFGVPDYPNQLKDEIEKNFNEMFS